MRAVICKGDRTSHGGRVLEGNPNVTTGGRQIAQLGHATICPLCKGKFPIIEGVASHTYGGKPTAVHGMKTACGATLLASQNEMLIDAGGGGGANRTRSFKSSPAHQQQPLGKPASYDPDHPMCRMPKWGSAEWVRTASNEELKAFYASLQGPRVEAIDAKAQAMIEYQRQTTRNSIGISLLAGFPGASLPGQLSRLAGANEYRVASANEIGGALAALEATVAGIQSKPLSATPTVDWRTGPIPTVRDGILKNLANSRAARESSNFNAPQIGLPSREWPPFPGTLGQVETNQTLLPGMIIDRFGPPQGSFLSPAGTSFSKRALKPGAYANDYHMYEVLRPLNVKAGEVRPWFGEMGHGTQYRLDPIEGVRRSPSTLTSGDYPYLKEIFNGKYWNRPQ